MLIPHFKPAFSFKDLFGKCGNMRKHVKHNFYWMGSGSSAIYLAVKSAGAKRVAVPAFTCSIVRDAVKKSGAEIQFYDSGLVTTLSDIKKALREKPDMLIISYNFGLIPDNLKKILNECRKKGVLVLEDCAQAFGFGQNADFTIYSFGISKCLSYYGGLLVSKKKLKLEDLPKLSSWKEMVFLIKAVINELVFRPWFYWLISGAVRRQIKENPLAKLYSISNFAKKVILRQLLRFGLIQKIRERNFSISERVKGVVKTESKSNLYLVLECKNRSRVISNMKKEGIEVLPAKSFVNIGGKGFPKAQKAEDKHLVFSLYRPRKEMSQFAHAMKKVLE